MMCRTLKRVLRRCCGRRYFGQFEEAQKSAGLSWGRLQRCHCRGLLVLPADQTACPEVKSEPVEPFFCISVTAAPSECIQQQQQDLGDHPLQVLKMVRAVVAIAAMVLLGVLPEEAVDAVLSPGLAPWVLPADEGDEDLEEAG